MLLRCLGTFAEEKDDEEISYGLVFPVNSWDPVYTQVRRSRSHHHCVSLSASRVNLIHFYHTLWFQFFYYRHVLGRAWAADSWLNALKVLLMGPGWQPGKPRLGVITDIPDVSIDVTLIGTWRDLDCSVLH